MMNKQIVLVTLITFALAATEYSREFQLNLDMTYFDSGRDIGFNKYLNSFEVAGVPVTNMTRSVSYRTQQSIPLATCGSDAKLRLREYIQGDRTGFTMDLKSGQSLNEAEALAEPFTIASEYVVESKYEIEYDIQPCRADFAATARIYFDSRIAAITSCDAVREYYPEFSNVEGTLEQDESSSIVFVEAYNGFAWGGEIKLEFTLYYDSLGDAENDINRDHGEFSITIYAPVSDQYTSAQTEKGIEVYNYMLNDLGDPDYPCEPFMNVADFFEEDYLNNINSSAVCLFVNIFSLGGISLAILFL